MELIKLLLEDVITTGTGAAFTPGQGEQYATPFAFGKRGGKKKRMPSIRKRIFEETEYTPEAGKVEYEKLNKALLEVTSRVDRFIKAFRGFSVESMLSNKSSVEKLKNLGERIWENLEDIHDTADDLAWKAEEKKDREGYKNYTEITNSCRGLQKSLDTIGEAIDAIQKAAEKMNLEEDRCLDIARRKYDKPSAYRSGAIVRCRKGDIWKEGEEINEDESLHKWFSRKGPEGKKGGWVDCNTCKNVNGKKKCKACGRGEGEKRRKYPSCRPTPSQCSDKGKGKTWGKTK